MSVERFKALLTVRTRNSFNTARFVATDFEVYYDKNNEIAGGRIIQVYMKQLFDWP